MAPAVHLGVWEPAPSKVGATQQPGPSPRTQRHQKANRLNIGPTQSNTVILCHTPSLLGKQETYIDLSKSHENVCNQASRSQDYLAPASWACWACKTLSGQSSKNNELKTGYLFMVDAHSLSNQTGLLSYCNSRCKKERFTSGSNANARIKCTSPDLDWCTAIDNEDIRRPWLDTAWLCVLKQLRATVEAVSAGTFQGCIKCRQQAHWSLAEQVVPPSSNTYVWKLQAQQPSAAINQVFSAWNHLKCKQPTACLHQHPDLESSRIQASSLLTRPFYVHFVQKLCYVLCQCQAKIPLVFGHCGCTPGTSSMQPTSVMAALFEGDTKDSST